MYSWSSWRTLVPLLGGVLVLVGWAVYSYSGIISKPMIPLVVFNDRTAAISYFGNLVHGLAVRRTFTIDPTLELTNIAAIRPLVLSPTLLSSSTQLLASYIRTRPPPPMSPLRPLNSNNRSLNRKNPSHKTLQFHRLAPLHLRINRTQPSQSIFNCVRLDHP